ncbi:unnamed protein product [Caenorhabditis brenneri]
MVSIPFKKFMMAYKLPGAELKFKFRESRPIYRFPCNLRNNNFGIHLGFPNRRGISLVFPFPRMIFPGKWRKVNGTPMLVENCHGHFVFGGDKKMKEKMDYMEGMAKHLTDVCHVTSYLLQYDGKVEEFDIFKCFVWNFVERFEKIEMECDMTQDQVRFLLNNVKCDEMVLRSFVKEKVKVLQIKSKSLSVHRHGNWLTVDHIIGSECEKITGQIHEAKPAKTVELVKEWQNGEKLTNLKMLDLILGSKCTDQSPALEIIDKFDGVKKFTETEKQILEKGEMEGKFPSGEVRKILRATDGKIAVLSVNEHHVKMKVLENGEVLKDF